MKYNTIYAFGENNESDIRSRQVPVWRGLISIVLSVINSGTNNYYGIDRIPVCTGSGMYRLHCICILQISGKINYAIELRINTTADLIGNILTLKEPSTEIKFSTQLIFQANHNFKWVKITHICLIL